jgi:hypothetical protein
MLSLPSSVRLFLCTQPVDLRKSFDGLLGLVQTHFHQDPLSGHLFLFVNRRRDRMKVLFWEPHGLVIWYKRLESGTFQEFRPPNRARNGDDSGGIEISAVELSLILGGIDLDRAVHRKRYVGRAG